MDKVFVERDAVIERLERLMQLQAPTARAIIEAIPAADVRPVKRGKWVQDCDYHFRCSICGDRWIISNGNPLDVANGWNFCSNCGAMMEDR